MKTSDKGKARIGLREGNILHAYRDIKGIWTIGVGHTAAAGYPPPAKGMTITYDQSMQILGRDLADVEEDVNRLVKVPLTQNQFDALVSFVFNIGVTAFAKSTLLRRLNAKDYKGAAAAFDMWWRAGIRTRALKSRRDGEKAQFLS